MVSRTLRAEKRYEDAAAVAHYLEKIIQIDYRLPVPDDGEAAALVADLVHRSGTGELLGAAEPRSAGTGSPCCGCTARTPPSPRR